MGVNMGVRIEKGIYGHWVNFATRYRGKIRHVILEAS